MKDVGRLAPTSRRTPTSRLAPTSRVATLVGVVALASISVAALTSLLLGWWYQPTWVTWLDTAGSGRAMGHLLVRFHEVAAAVAVTAACLWVLVVVVRVVRGPRPERPVVALFAGVVAAAGVVVASMTWGLVAWDQIAFWAVTVGTDVWGLWFAAFSDEVRFVLVAGAEVAPATLARWLIVHMASSVVAVVAIVVSWWASQPRTAESGVTDADEVPVFGLERL
ncbi:MAG: hypothetical protein JJE52_06560 [Acidimicrobiia bacterium]|nr:hypothetical protein [Acidimicrobiia bacterium]